VLTNCDKHLRINPNDAVAYGRRGLTRLLIGDAGEPAWKDLDNLVRLQPGFRPALELLVEEAKRQSLHPRPQGP